MNSNSYWNKYSNNELDITKLWLKSLAYTDKSLDSFLIIEKDNTSFHDIKVNNIKTQKDLYFTIEVKEEENYWYCKTGNIGLDLISAFNFTNINEKKYFENKKNWVNPEDQKKFFDSIKIYKDGKLYNCDANIQLFYCKSERNTPLLLEAYMNNLLIENREYFLNKYPIGIF